MITGQNAETDIKFLNEYKNNVFRKSGIDSFVIGVDRYLIKKKNKNFPINFIQKKYKF